MLSGSRLICQLRLRPSEQFVKPCLVLAHVTLAGWGLVKLDVGMPPKLSCAATPSTHATSALGDPRPHKHGSDKHSDEDDQAKHIGSHLATCVATAKRM